MREIFAGTVAFFISLLVTRLMIVIGTKDVPNERSSHSAPTPKGGGIGVILGFYVAILILDPHTIPFVETWSLWVGLLAGGVIAAGFSFIDDVRSLNPFVRLCVQVAIAVWFLSLGSSLDTLYFPIYGEVELGAWAFPLSLLWLVGFMNAYNFMDGLNGMVGGTTLISCLFLALIFMLHVNYLFYVACLMLFAAICGFIGYNIPKARIFMGEVGSQSLGFLLGGLFLIAAQPDFGGLSFWTFPVLFFMFLYDALFSVLYRGFKGKNVLRPHREFLFHLLHRSGWTHLRVTSLYAFFAVLQGVIAFSMQYIYPTKHVLILGPLLLFGIGYTLWVFQTAKEAGVEF